MNEQKTNKIDVLGLEAKAEFKLTLEEKEAIKAWLSEKRVYRNVLQKKATCNCGQTANFPVIVPRVMLANGYNFEEKLTVLTFKNGLGKAISVDIGAEEAEDMIKALQAFIEIKNITKQIDRLKYKVER